MCLRFTSISSSCVYFYSVAKKKEKERERYEDTVALTENPVTIHETYMRVSVGVKGFSNPNSAKWKQNKDNVTRPEEWMNGAAGAPKT